MAALVRGDGLLFAQAIAGWTTGDVDDPSPRPSPARGEGEVRGKTPHLSPGERVSTEHRKGRFTMAERGRPTKLDPERRRQLCGLVSVGFSRWHAARHLGVGKTTLFRAAKQDPEFEEQLRNAELHQELKPIKRIADHPSWRAMAWLLERQKPDLYVRRAHRYRDPGRSVWPVQCPDADVAQRRGGSRSRESQGQL